MSIQLDIGVGRGKPETVLKKRNSEPATASRCIGPKTNEISESLNNVLVLEGDPESESFVDILEKGFKSVNEAFKS